MATHAVSLSRGKVDLGVAAIDFALCGDTAQAQSLADELIKRFPQESINIGIVNPMIRAAIENSRGNYTQAIEILQPASRFELGNVSGFWINYLRAQALWDSVPARKRPSSIKRYSTIALLISFHLCMHWPTLGSRAPWH